MLTDEVEFNLEKEVCIPISIDFEKAPLGNSTKVTLFYVNIKKRFFANLWLTIHGWSPNILVANCIYIIYLKCPANFS